MEELLWIGGGFIIVWLVLWYWVEKRRFNRRGVAGLQHFSSFEKGLILSTIERIVSFLGYVFLILGLLSLLVYWVTLSEEGKDQKIEESEGNFQDAKTHFLVPVEKDFS